MFVPFLIIRYIHAKTKQILLGVHICHPAGTLPTTPTPYDILVQKVSSMIAWPFWHASETGLPPCACEWHGGLLGLAQLRKREIRGKRRVRGLLVQLGLVLITTDSVLKPGRMLR